MSRSVLRALAVGLALLVLGVVGRVLPHPPNVTPMAAIALYGGFAFRRRAVPLLLVVASMVLGDLLVGFYDYRVMGAVYLGLALPVLFGARLRTARGVLPIAAWSVAGSIAFFLVSNFAHWAFMSHYDGSLGGLLACYTAALPFLELTVLGDLVFAACLFGLHHAVVALHRVAAARAEIAGA